jgi:preprotein translocase subunit SecG
MFGVAFCVLGLLLYMLSKEKQKEGPKESKSS